MYITTSSGRISMNITKEQAWMGFHPGECDSDISNLRSVPAIARQLKRIDTEVLKQELKEYSDWDVSDHDTNLSRILWLLCGDIVERDMARGE